MSHIKHLMDRLSLSPSDPADFGPSHLDSSPTPAPKTSSDLEPNTLWRFLLAPDRPALSMRAIFVRGESLAVAVERFVHAMVALGVSEPHQLIGHVTAVDSATELVAFGTHPRRDFRLFQLPDGDCVPQPLFFVDDPTPFLRAWATCVAAVWKTAEAQAPRAALAFKSPACGWQFEDRAHNQPLKDIRCSPKLPSAGPAGHAGPVPLTRAEVGLDDDFDEWPRRATDARKLS